nr:protein glutamine dumper 3 [Quercus suber]
MRPSCSFTPSPSPVTRLQLWKSPMPYLFGGLAIMLILIFMALIILACSSRKQASGSSSEGEENQAMPMNMVVDTEPKIVVIMAGDDKPTYLAKPTCSIELV